MNMVPISIMLIIIGMAVGMWHGLKWLFGWDGIGLGLATLFVTWLGYMGLEALVGWIRDRRAPKP